MNSRDERIDTGWESLGRAAEHLARRVARDAGRFAERMEEHAGAFAHDISRDWRRRRHHRRSACGQERSADVRRIFEDVRTVLADVLDGIDELIERVFPERDAATDQDWIRMVSNRAGACTACGRAIAVGDDTYARPTDDGQELRCLDCGASSAAGA